MAGGTWRASRLALTAGGLALLAGAPAVLAATGVKNPWVLGGAAAAAAVIVVFSAVWQDRYRRLVQRRDEQEFRVQDGCLVLADGRLPAVRDITDPVMLGVHQAIVLAEAAPSRAAAPGGPAYVPRDVDGELRELLAAGRFVLLVGDSTAGKSPAAFEAVSATLPGHVLICPSGRDAIAVAADRAARERRCVLWLDDLERYLGAGGLTAAQLGRLLSGAGHHRVIVATIRAAEQARLTGDALGDETGRQVSRDIRQVLDQAHPVRVTRMFTGDELERARVRDWDPRIAEAISHAGSYGIAEYLAAGPELLRDWQDARASSEGPHARGAALVAAAIDIRRAGCTSALPRALLGEVHEQYLAEPEHAHAPLEPADNAWAWATRQRRARTALLRPAGPDLVEVFDYLVDTVQRRAGPLAQVPEPVVRAAIGSAGAADADSLAETAYAQGRYALAEYAWRRAYQANNTDPALGPDHPSTLTSRNNLALVLYALGRLDEAEAEHRAEIEVCSRVLGPDHPDTLTSRNNLALVLGNRGRLDEAEAEHRAVLETRTRVLGPDHPDTLASRNNLALVLYARGRLDEGEAEHRAVLETRTRVLGPDHPDTLADRSNLALVLHDRGRLDEAEAENRAVMEGLARVLGGGRLVPGAEGPATAPGGAGPCRHERSVARRAAAAVAAGAARRAVRAAGGQGNPAARRQGGQRALPRLRPHDPASPRRSHRQPQGEGRAVRGNGGEAGRARAGRVLAAAADRADTPRPAARSPDVAGRHGRAVRPAVRAHGARGAGHAGVYSHITPGMRAGLKAVLQELWERSLHERSRLAPRSGVAVLDGPLAPYRGTCSKIDSLFAPRIGHTAERRQGSDRNSTL